MNNFNKLNIAQICSIKSCLKSYPTNIKWAEKEILFLFFNIKITPGFYDSYTIGSPILYTAEELEKKHLYSEGEKIYYYPHLEITMSDGKMFIKYFKTKEELITYMSSDDFKEITWIEN